MLSHTAVLLQRGLVRRMGSSSLNMCAFSSIPSAPANAASSLSLDSTKVVVKHPHSLDGSPLDLNAPTPSRDLFAVIAMSGTQYKVCPDDTIVVDKMEGVDIGDQIDITEVLLVGSRKTTMVGQPFVPGTKVLASVEEMAKDKKVISFKTRRRKASKRLKGFRRQICVLRIDDIVLSDEDKNIV